MAVSMGFSGGFNRYLYMHSGYYFAMDCIDRLAKQSNIE